MCRSTEVAFMSEAPSISYQSNFCLLSHFKCFVPAVKTIPNCEALTVLYSMVGGFMV